MGKDTFLAFTEWEDNCEDLSDEEFGQMMRALFKYVKNGEKPAFSDRTMRSCWRPIQQAIDRAEKAYEDKCEQNRKNGKKGGAPKGNQNARKQPKQPKTTETTLPHPNPNPNIGLAVSPGATATQGRKYSDEHYDKLQQLYSKFGEKGQQ